MKIQNPSQKILSGREGSQGKPTAKNLEFSRILSKKRPLSENSSGKGLITVGTITRDKPTISHLLCDSPLKKECWNIIHNPINTNKPFHTIRPGTPIGWSPESGELLWGKELEERMAESRSPSGPALPDKTAGNLSESVPGLSQAVKNFIGQDYEKMDCYELVVGGLQHMGVQYRGKGGLGQHLVNQALKQGLPRNHYLNGEGLVSASGTPVFKKTIFRVNDVQKETEALMAEIQNQLAQGQILSFSMRDKGHTGVISRLSGQWTFVNSGDMDHNLAGANGTKQVGEEVLKSEFKNWLSLAFESGQGLKITLGSLNPDLLSRFTPTARGRFSRKV